MALLLHEGQCHHKSCAGRSEKRDLAPGERRRMSPATWRCDCPCHSLTGEAREAWIKSHPTELESKIAEAMKKLEYVEGSGK